LCVNFPNSFNTGRFFSTKRPKKKQNKSLTRSKKLTQKKIAVLSKKPEFAEKITDLLSKKKELLDESNPHFDIMSPILFSKIRNLLGNPIKFAAMSASEQISIQREVDLLIGVDKSTTQVWDFNPNRASRSLALSKKYSQERALFKDMFLKERERAGLTSGIAMLKSLKQSSTEVIIALGLGEKMLGDINNIIVCDLIYQEILATVIQCAQSNLFKTGALQVSHSELMVHLTK